jgi:hypothetical protein
VVTKKVVRAEHQKHSVAGSFAEYLQEFTNLGRSEEVKAALQSVL